MVPFTPRLVQAILPNLAHHVPMIQTAAKGTNKLLFNVIRNLPPPVDSPGRQSSDKTSSSTPSQAAPSSPAPNPSSLTATRPPTLAISQPTRDVHSPESPPEANASSQVTTSDRSSLASAPRRTSVLQEPVRGATVTQQTQSAVAEPSQPQTSRPASPISAVSIPQVQQSPEASMVQERDAFDYQVTVNTLTIQFLSEHEETRVAALKWLIMLHQKAPKKVCLQCLGICH